MRCTSDHPRGRLSAKLAALATIQINRNCASRM
jgi:hypothetical protein